MPSFKRIDHVVIGTKDLEAATRRWKDTLGLKAEDIQQPVGTGFRAARLPVGEAFLELLQPLSGSNGRFARRFQEKGEGIFSLSVEVDDLDAAVAYLKDQGVTPSTPEAGIWPRTRVARVSGSFTHGVSLQLIEFLETD